MSSSVSTFEHVADTLRLSREAKARAWETLREVRIGPEDPEAVRILLHVAMVEDAARIKSAVRVVLEEARSTITNAAKETAGNLASAAEKVERASAGRLAARQAELVTQVSAEIAASADRALTRKVAVHARNSLATWVTTACLAAAVTWGVGYSMGQSSTDANVARITSMFTREDGAEWRRLMEANNATATLATYCRNGSANVHRVDGGTYCLMPLWLQHDAVVSPVPGSPVDALAVRDAVSAWLASWGPWWLLAAGTIGFVLLRLLAAYAFEAEPLRRLLALPVRIRPLED
jgi:hypothetical protein